MVIRSAATDLIRAKWRRVGAIASMWSLVCAGVSCVRGRTDFPAARRHNYRNGGGVSIAGYARQSLSGNQFLHLLLLVASIAVTLFFAAKNATGTEKEIQMNWDRIAGNWKQAKDKMKTIKTMKLCAGLKKIRAFERLQLPFLRCIVDFDIVIDIGYVQEQGQPLTVKQLFLLNISSRATVRRKLARLIEQGIVIRRIHANDSRAKLLLNSPSTVKLLGKYGSTIASISALHFT